MKLQEIKTTFIFVSCIDNQNKFLKILSLISFEIKTRSLTTLQQYKTDINNLYEKYLQYKVYKIYKINFFSPFFVKKQANTYLILTIKTLLSHHKRKRRVA